MIFSFICFSLLVKLFCTKMSSRREFTGQLDQTIAMLEEQIAAIEAEGKRLTRLVSTQPMGVKVPSQMPSPMGRAETQAPGTRSYVHSTPDTEFNDLPKSLSNTCVGICRENVHKDNGSALQSVVKPKKPVVEPDNYDGKTNLEDWLTNLNLCCQINGWIEEQKTKFLAVRLRGPALQVYTDLPETSKLCLADVVKALKERFSPQGQTGLFRAQLKVRSRKKDEALPELASDIRRLVSKAYPDVSAVLREELGRDYFIEALDSPDVRMQVRRAKPKDLGAALTVALEEEAFFQVEYNKANFLQRIGANACQDRAAESPVSHSQDHSELKHKIEQLEQTVKELQLALKQNKAGKSKGPLICWNCRQEGHRHFQCPNTQPDVAQGGNSSSAPQENPVRLSMGSVPSQK